ncbi:ethanolamine utilization protein EutP [Acetitomaculum ruminis DSM 5522]|uniref:Ethanolamine utilization protein EutP n=1 Tax=Acetitomaculum ruminis DSM 5522 TaxID=1120918 RepID=A0A1I0ZTK5_9FIRM|nr:EutP/PduV family microcompartment system protein [Acetitomaculum ruminis]SFB29044.1 ethanolamine utilization protein EutP [Acetitomaculum ruminis DSM 5522]
MDEKKKKRIILIGRSMSGKTTLCQYMDNKELKYHKTQTIQIFNDFVIDTPGEYLERGSLRGALTVTAVEADLIVLVQEADEEGTMFPPGYSSTFAKPCIGIVTKSDLADERKIEYCEKCLKMAGAKEVFVTSSYTGSGFEELMDFLEKFSEK